MAIGVNIRLPFETEANPDRRDDKLVEMKYFFTRKLMLMKESSGFLVLPGGFGTLDEASSSSPWCRPARPSRRRSSSSTPPETGTGEAWEQFVGAQVSARGLADPLARGALPHHR